ncbi:MAG: hypothetical protein ACRDNW_00015 [Trebonia sp.]
MSATEDRDYSDWSVRTLGSILDKLEAGVSVNSVVAPGPYGVLKTSCVSDGEFDPSERKTVAPTDLKRVKVSPHAGSLIISRANTPELVGQVGYVRSDYPSLFLSDKLWLASKRSGIPVDMRWLSYMLSSAQYRERLRELATGTSGSMKNISRESFLQILVPFPSIDEQAAIVGMLVGFDQEMDSLRRMIAKISAVRQGMVQQLLAGFVRLPGFSRTWSSVSLGTLGNFLKGQGITRDDVRMSGTPCIRYGELYTVYSEYTYEARSFVSQEVASAALRLRTGDLLFAGSGETREDIGRCVAYMGEATVVAGGDLIVLRGDSFNPIYVALLMNIPFVASQKARAGQGDAVVHISSHALGMLSVSLPERDEQDAITSVILDADRELSSLYQWLAKVQSMKQGMMQQLLTGRIRLPV